LSEPIDDSTLYDIHNLIKIRVVGSRSEPGKIIDSTLSNFRSKSTNDPSTKTDMTMVLGQYPSSNWEVSGTTVGDRILYDEKTESTTIFKRPINSSSNADDIEYIIMGGVRNTNSEVFVYVPNLALKTKRIRAVLTSIATLHLTRGLLAAIGDNDLLNERIEEETAKLRLAILEPFLYYRLPSSDASLVHASVVEMNGEGIMFAGTGHVGKTSLAIMMIKNGCSYLGDDLVIIDGNGTVLAYPEPIRFQKQHWQMVSDVVEKSFNHENWLKRKIYSGLLEVSPEEFFRLRPRVSISQISDSARVANSCALRRVVLIRRRVLKEPLVRKVESESVSAALAAELFWEFEVGHWRHNQYLLSPSAAKGEDFLGQEQNHRSKIASILDSALRKATCYLFEIPLKYGPIETFYLLDKWIRST
jgi:hypothetical protein